MKKNTQQSFWARVRKTETCWIWTAALNVGGYGKFYVNGKAVPAHRYAYELFSGAVPPGLCLDHLCRNRRCVNPAHLEAVTPKENCLRGESRAAANAVVTHCPVGHAYDAANTYVYRGRRYCRACIKLRTAKKDKKEKRWLARVDEQRERRKRLRALQKESQ